MIFYMLCFVVVLKVKTLSYLIHVFCVWVSKKAMDLDSLFLVVFQITQLSFINQKSLCVGNEHLTPLLKPPIWLCISSQF